ncbi:MAG TPA: methyltransferase domain-containing protein [Caulobacteraceae bacterium]|jgi:SAM-dependent methyltransferase
MPALYDDETFFTGYSGMIRSKEGLDGAAEWPAMRALLPPLGGLRVLDLGCGFGWFARWAAAEGAASVLGVDVSERMLERARAMTENPAIAYERGDLEVFEPAAQSVDLIYSSLALHYIDGLERLFGVIRQALTPGGRLAFSVEHPIFTAPSAPGWTIDAAGRKVWPVDGYQVEGPRTTHWLGRDVVKQHRTIGTYVALLLGAGFTLAHLEEWAPSAAEVEAHPDWADERQRPMFMLMAAQI